MADRVGALVSRETQEVARRITRCNIDVIARSARTAMLPVVASAVRLREDQHEKIQAKAGPHTKRRRMLVRCSRVEGWLGPFSRPDAAARRGRAQRQRPDPADCASGRWRTIGRCAPPFTHI
jgi:hypothetical protein